MRKGLTGVVCKEYGNDGTGDAVQHVQVLVGYRVLRELTGVVCKEDGYDRTGDAVQHVQVLVGYRVQREWLRELTGVVCKEDGNDGTGDTVQHVQVLVPVVERRLVVHHRHSQLQHHRDRRLKQKLANAPNLKESESFF